MHQYHILNSTDSANPHLPQLLKQLENVRSQRTRLYYTYIEGDDDPTEDKQTDSAQFTFVTPSKQMHLGLGMMSWDGQLHLAWLLEYEFQNGENKSQLILYMEERENGVLVTRTEESDGTIVFTLSPAN